MTALVTAPHVYRAIHAISAALSKAGIAKTHTNLQDQYLYRLAGWLPCSPGTDCACFRACWNAKAGNDRVKGDSR